MTRIPQALITIGLLTVGVAAFADDDDVTLDQLPEAVRRTVESEVGDGRIAGIERDDDVSGAPLYEIEFFQGGSKYELDVDSDGTLLQRHRD